MKIITAILKEKIEYEFSVLKEQIDSLSDNSFVSSDMILEHSEYLFIRSRIYICFHDYHGYLDIDERAAEFLLGLGNTSEYLAYIFINGLAGDCDARSVEGIIKLMLFSYNHAMLIKGKSDLILPVEVTL